ncbi:hypothetical protein M5689_010863 [Euphorbia peplus]|nr:hypothetical protein M5689_010863 [Euphorbia peplus]
MRQVRKRDVGTLPLFSRASLIHLSRSSLLVCGSTRLLRLIPCGRLYPVIQDRGAKIRFHYRFRYSERLAGSAI